jgi:hypothetical protein
MPPHSQNLPHQETRRSSLLKLPLWYSIYQRTGKSNIREQYNIITLRMTGTTIVPNLLIGWTYVRAHVRALKRHCRDTVGGISSMIYGHYTRWLRDGSITRATMLVFRGRICPEHWPYTPYDGDRHTGPRPRGYSLYGLE